MLSVIFKSCAVGIVLYGGYLVFESQFTEQLGYKVLETGDSSVELRQYQPFIVAEIDVEAANSREAATKGFRPLAGYIFGGNIPREKIKMTAPVASQALGGEKISMTAPVTTQARKGENISMTAPVTTAQSPDSDTYTVQFAMPSKWTMDTLPQPDDENIRLLEKPAQLRIAKTYRGDPAADEIAAAKERLLNHAEREGFIASGAPIWAGYSSPAVPGPLRKWEVMLPVTR